ncbi:MAG: hypothetical protein ABIN61_04355 [candidate division WOR-3 bacterium]
MKRILKFFSVLVCFLLPFQAKSEGKIEEFSSLKLSEDVIQKIKEVKVKYKEKILELKNEIEKKILEIEKLLLEKNPNFDKILSLEDEIGELRQKVRRKLLEEKIEIYKIIPDEKKEEAKNFLFRFLRERQMGKEECPKKR